MNVVLHLTQCLWFSHFVTSPKFFRFARELRKHRKRYVQGRNGVKSLYFAYLLTSQKEYA